MLLSLLQSFLRYLTPFSHIIACDCTQRCLYLHCSLLVLTCVHQVGRRSVDLQVVP